MGKKDKGEVIDLAFESEKDESSEMQEDWFFSEEGDSEEPPPSPPPKKKAKRKRVEEEKFDDADLMKYIEVPKLAATELYERSQLPLKKRKKEAAPKAEEDTAVPKGEEEGKKRKRCYAGNAKLIEYISVPPSKRVKVISRGSRTRQRALTKDEKRQQKALERIRQKCRKVDESLFRPSPPPPPVKLKEQTGEPEKPKHGVRRVLGIDIGWRNGGYCNLDLETNRFVKWKWGDLFADPEDMSDDQMEVPERFAKYVRENPVLFDAEVWAIEKQPDNQTKNVALQFAIMAVGALMGKRVVIVNPRDIKAVFCNYFQKMGDYEDNKAVAMDIIASLLVEKEREWRDKQRYAQREKDKTYKKRYKHAKMPGSEWSPVWDDMADGALIAFTIAKMYTDRDLIQERADANNVKTLQEDPNAWLEFHLDDY